MQKASCINGKSHLKKVAFESEPAGTRTQGPYIKSVLLYQLSYGIADLRVQIYQKYSSSNPLFGIFEKYIQKKSGFKETSVFVGFYGVGKIYDWKGLG